MALFTRGIYSLLRFLQQPSYRWALLHALATALAVDIRILGDAAGGFYRGHGGLGITPSNAESADQSAAYTKHAAVWRRGRATDIYRVAGALGGPT